MKKICKYILILSAFALACTMLVSCGPKLAVKPSANSKEFKEELNPDLNLVYSSWEYSEDSNCLYYVISLKNTSSKDACTSAAVKVTRYKETENQKIKPAESEIISCPKIKPGQTVYIGSVGMSCKTSPANVKFKIASSGDWMKFSGKNENDLAVTSSGIRTELSSDSSDNGYDSSDKKEYKDLYDEDYDDDLFDFDEEFEDLEVDLDDNSLSEDIEKSNVMEYYGTIENNINSDIDNAMVCVIFKDENGKMVSGEYTMISDIKAGETTDFVIDSCSGLARSSYDIFAYIW